MFDFSRLPLRGPEGRANAIRASLVQISALPGAEVSIPALAGAFARLGFPSSDDGPREAARRVTCGEVAEALAAALPEGEAFPHPVGAYPWFQAQIDAWTGSEDPRLAVMAATAARELSELRAICGEDAS